MPGVCRLTKSSDGGYEMMASPLLFTGAIASTRDRIVGLRTSGDRRFPGMPYGLRGC
jgi:hypothetical protein